MADRRSSLSLAVALLVPFLALGAMVARAEVTTRRGHPWLIAITGYDPRDLVRGHYLRYRLDWRGGAPVEECTAAPCCYCFRASPGAPPVEPDVSKVSCSAVSACESWFPDERLEALQKFFIPEDRASALESDLRSRKAQLLVRVSSDGDAVITDLLLDGRPWRDVVK